MYLPGGKQKYGGIFNDEVDAGKRVNQVCEEWGLAPKNPQIVGILNEQQVTFFQIKFS